MSIFALISLLVTLAALFSVLSLRVLKLPSSVGAMLLALAASAALLSVGRLVPGLQASAKHIVGGIDFDAVVLHGMLSVLLFAGALQLDVDELMKEKLPVATLSIVSTALSTLLVAGIFKLVLTLTGFAMSWMGALLFGALISPTDPIAVLEMLRRVGAPKRLEVQLAGESLFNDGIGAVIFLALLSASAGAATPSVSSFLVLLALKAGGAILLGVVLGYLAYLLLRRVDQYRVEILITLALAMGGYALADALHVSAPLEVVTAGMFAGGRVRRLAMSEDTRAHVDRFWELMDDMFNVILFLLLGLELLVLPLHLGYLLVGLFAIPVALLSRWVSVSLPMWALSRLHEPVQGGITVLTWGGLRGGLAVALALSLPSGRNLERNHLLIATYVVVVFSVLVQGLTIAPLLRRLGLAAETPPMVHQS